MGNIEPNQTPVTGRATPNAASFDAYSPPQIAQLIENVGVRKASLPKNQLIILSVLAGAFISFGAMFYTLVITGNDLGFGVERLLGGMAFSLGLVLVVIAGAELFTGNNLIVMAWADGKISTAQLLTNWSLVYVGNFVGALACVAFVRFSGTLELGGGSVASTAVAIANAKVELGFFEAFLRGMLCNTLVCLAIWLSYASHQVPGKILCILFPVSAFVALGFEHSIANMYLIPIGMLASGTGIDTLVLLGNLVPVTLGNIVGGSVFVALVYWDIYLHGKGESMQ